MPKIDLRFLEELKSGNEHAVNYVRNLCFSYIRRYINDDDMTKELVDSTMEKVIVALGSFGPKKGRGTVESNFKMWMRRIAYNVYLDYRHRKKREVTFGELETALGIDDEDRAVIGGDYETLDEMLSIKAYERHPFTGNPEWNLAAREVISVFEKIEDSRKRVALILKFIYGLTTKEIAGIMKENFDSIQSVIHRSSKELKALLLKRGIDSQYLDAESWRIKHAARRKGN